MMMMMLLLFFIFIVIITTTIRRYDDALTDSLTRTGELRLDERGQRVRRHALLQVQERRVRRVADLTEDFEIRDDLKWPGGQLPAASTDPPDIKRSGP